MNGENQPQKLPQGTRLISELRLMEDLWNKVLKKQWAPEPFDLLGRLARTVLRTAKERNDAGLLELASDLKRLVDNCLAAKRLPQDDERELFSAILDEIRLLLFQDNTPPKERLPLPAAPIQTSEVYVVDTGDAKQLIGKLEESGFRVHYFKKFGSAEVALAQKTPLAAIVNVGPPSQPLEGIRMVSRLRSRSDFTAPVFFTSKQGDFDTRLEAVRAGGVGFLSEPVDVAAFLEKLNQQVFHDSEQSRQRVLIVDDTLANARAMGDALEAWDFQIEVVSRPGAVLQTLQDFQPNLIVLDLDLQGISGLEMVKVLRQHELCETLPLILLTEPANVAKYLPYLGREADDLLSKPVNPDYLCWVVHRRLSQARAVRNKLTALSQRDAVSGLFSRQYFLAELENVMLASGTGKFPVAAMLIILENWRAVREDMDLAASDEVLRRIAKRLQRAFGLSQTVARFGDSVFATLFEGADRDKLLTEARAIRESLENAAYKVGQHTVHVRVCIGISMAEEGDQDFLGLIQHADLACSLARETGSQGVHIHDSRVDQKFKESREQHLLEQISEALLQERMSLLFQPIVNLKKGQDERYEVFLRMHDREGQELLPETVFGVVQQHALGARLDGWVISRAIQLLLAYRSRTASRTLFVNISPATLQSKALRAWLRERMEKVKLNPRRLVFEVTENTARRYLDELRSFMDEAGALGCGFCLERFGRRGDSLRLLEQLAVDYVKFDNYFAQNLKGKEGNYVKQQLKDLVDSLKKLGVVIIMGGIEELTPLPMLWSYGIDCVQGYFLQRPHKEMSYDFSGETL